VETLEKSLAVSSSLSAKTNSGTKTYKEVNSLTTSKKPWPTLADGSYLIDTHCHLDMSAYRNDLRDIIKKATSYGIDRIVTIGIDIESSRSGIELSKTYDEISATIGIHPHDVKNSSESDLSALHDLYTANSNHIVGYGEIGLDYVKLHSPKEIQLDFFSRQLSLAAELKLPVIIHNREADDDTLDILRKKAPFIQGGIMHCFSGDYSYARKVLDLGLLISIPGIVTFKNSAVLQEVVKKIPLASMVLETDGPFLAPHPFRGKRNEPHFILYTAQKIAEIKKINLEEVARQTSLNSEKLFNFQ
jgi:TatD DNase family protein